jgi:hypothetical protein
MDIVLISNEEEYENICQKLTESTIENYETTPLNSKERSKIYEIMKKYPSLETQTTSIGVTGLKQIIIRRKKSDEKKTIDSLAIKLFCKYMIIPFPTFNPKYVDYYLELMDTYYDCKRKWKIYLEVLEKQNPSSIKNEINTVCAKIIEHIKTSEEYNNFISEEHKIPNIKIGNELYSMINKNKIFVSIDVRSANYRVLKENCPSLCENLEWNDFIKKFTSNEFIIQSKYFREVVFGKLGCKLIADMPLVFINRAINAIEEKYSSYLKKIRCSNDEVIYEVLNDKLESWMYVMDEFKQEINKLDNLCYRVDVFKLVQLGNRAYFVKEAINNKKIEFKSIPKKFSAQCIKYYEKKPINSIDKKFTDEILTNAFPQRRLNVIQNN